MSTVKIKEYPDAIWFKTICDCTHNDCTQTIAIEQDKDLNGAITIQLYNNIYLRAYYEKWYKNLWRRIKLAFRILFIGWIEMEGDIILRGEDIKSYFTALETAYTNLQRSTGNDK
jgi:hypothetical protein